MNRRWGSQKSTNKIFYTNRKQIQKSRVPCLWNLVSFYWKHFLLIHLRSFSTRAKSKCFQILCLFFAFLCTHINRVHDQHTIPSCCSEALFVCICFSSHTRKKMCCTTILWRMFWGKGNFMMKKGVAVAKYTIQLHRASSDNNREKLLLLFFVIVQEGNL